MERELFEHNQKMGRYIELLERTSLVESETTRQGSTFYTATDLQEAYPRKALREPKLPEGL